MTASVTGIWNMALSHIGDRANISDTDEQSVSAENCRLFYPLALETALTDYPWSFATARERLAPLKKESWNWKYAYAYPLKALRVVSIGNDESATSEATFPYETMRIIAPTEQKSARVILTDVENAVAFYIYREQDTGVFPPLFTEALSFLLASYLAGAQIRGDAALSKKQALYQSYLGLLMKAEPADANQRNTPVDFIPSSIAARG